jgi:alpha-tubulin suppressor-like RCC1 family protein
VGGGLLALLVALLPGVPASADVAWPDGVGPDSVRAMTVGAASVAAGTAHSCAITSVGAIHCWGDNSDGQLGNGAAPAGSTVAVAVRNAGAIRIAVQVDAGDEHTCAINFDGLAFCWGDNSSGQLGIGAGADEHAPVRVEALADRTLVEIATGANHSCAIDDRGAAWCWGANAAGQLGVGGGQAADRAVPARVSTATGMTDPVVDIAAGKDTTCAATAEGIAWCWGAGGDGQLGYGGAADRAEPVRVSTAGPLDDVKVRQIAVGKEQSCAVDDAGRASCWGRTAGGSALTPAAVGGPSFRQVAAGTAHVCGLDRDASAYCWGDGGDGRLGDGGADHAIDPVRITQGARDLGSDLRDLDVGDRHSCALDERGVAYCWGADDAGQAGNGGSGTSRVPMPVVGLPRAPAAVTGVRVAALNGGLRVSWRPAGEFGSGRFVSYLAVTSTNESSCEVTAATGNGCDLPGLENGRDYDVAVLTVATDGNGLSDFATGAPGSRPAGGPSDTPTLAPGDDGGLPITGPGPLIMVTIGFLLVGLGLSALLVRRPG